MQSEWSGLTPPAAEAAAGDRLARQREALAQAEATLRTQRGELLRMMTELKQVQEAVRRGHAPELEALRRENDDLRRSLAEREQAAAVPPAVAEELAGLRGEVERLRRLLAEKEAPQDPQHEPPRPAGREAGDLESYEAELNQFRLQLEEDRRRLNEEREGLRVRNEETEEARREMEMELSRERAELARERTRLERLRDEARVEAERIQRDAGILNRLAPVQRLREELADRNPGPEPA